MEPEDGGLLPHPFGCVGTEMTLLYFGKCYLEVGESQREGVDVGTLAYVSQEAE